MRFKKMAFRPVLDTRRALVSQSLLMMSFESGQGRRIQLTKSTMNAYKIVKITPILLTSTLLASPPKPFGNLTSTTRAAVEATKSTPGIIMGDAESNLLFRHARSQGFGIASAPGNNYVGTSQNRDLILEPGASFGYAGTVGATYNGKSASRRVQLVDHALRGSPGGASAKLNLAQDSNSGRWTKDLVVVRPDGSKEEYRVWRGSIVKASESKMQLVDDQSLIAAAAPTRQTFLQNTLNPVSSAPTAFEGDRVLFTTPHAGINIVRRALANFDAPMRDTDWYSSLVSKDPSVGFLRQAARDDVRASYSAIKNEVDKWADRIAKWADRIKKWAKRIKSFIDVLTKIWGFF